MSGNVLLRRTQYRMADDKVKSVSIARNLLTAKIANCRNVLLRARREKNNEQEIIKLSKAAQNMARSTQQTG